MHPPPNDTIYKGRSRHSSFDDNTTTPMQAARGSRPTTYFMADEKTVEAADLGGSSQLRSRNNMKSSTLGVESLENTTSSITSTDSDDQEDDASRRAREQFKKNLEPNTPMTPNERMPSSSPPCKSPVQINRNLSHSRNRTRRVLDTSRPMTPSNLESPLFGSTPGSPMSCRGSETDFLTDDAASQAVASSGEEDIEVAESAECESTSQLVMPSLALPSRRPFTDKGKSLGKLKIMIAGDSGLGKTSLIKAIVQSCQDIVHVDTILQSPLSMPHSVILPMTARTKSRHNSGKKNATTDVTEIFASTRAYPSWWSEFDDSKVLRRRRLSADTVLERNVCFIDTPGFSTGTSSMESIVPVVEYLESHISRSINMSELTDNELIGMMSGGGASQVDVVFYLIDQKIKSIDIEYLRRLMPYTNIVPVVARADLLSPEKLGCIKDAVVSDLRQAGIRPFSCVKYDADSTSSMVGPCYAISTIPGTDHEVMDASILMSPDYVKPLCPSELPRLIEDLFNHETISCLRYTAARKCVLWRKDMSSSTASMVPQSLSAHSSFSSLTRSQVVKPPLGATNTYALARITDHTQREERLTQIRLSKWATDLQRSLQNERLRFEALARGERAVWLTERLNECVQDGAIVPLSSACHTNLSLSTYNSSFNSSTSLQQLVGEGVGASGVKASDNIPTHVRRPPKNNAPSSSPHLSRDARDPLGLVQLNAEMQRRSWAVLQIVGSFGVIGGLAIWLAKSSWSVLDVDGRPTAGWEWNRLLNDW